MNCSTTCLMFLSSLMQTYSSDEKVAALRLTFHFNPSRCSELSADTTYSFFYQLFLKYWQFKFHPTLLYWEKKCYPFNLVEVIATEIKKKRSTRNCKVRSVTENHSKKAKTTLQHFFVFFTVDYQLLLIDCDATTK